MLPKRANVALLMSVILLNWMIDPHASTELPDEQGMSLCVTSRREVQDLTRENLTSVPSNLSNNTKYLDLSYNPIRRLNGDSFVILPNLCFLKMTNCGLEEISVDTFDRIPALKALNMSSNKLLTIPELRLPNLKILDLTGNPHQSYALPRSFESLEDLEFLSLGSTTAQSVTADDFRPLKRIPLKHFALGAGIPWKKYEAGALLKLSFQKMSLNASFCGHFDLFDRILRDLNVTGATALRLITLFPDNCELGVDPLENLRTMPNLKNLTIESTWINSSFLELFFKNLWLSTIEHVSFVHITYNEDTPDGFQFKSLNHSISLRSFTFDGVKHYQYRYPTVNMSFDVVSNLIYLKFSGSGMNILPCQSIFALPSLETLDLANNLLTDHGFWWYTCSYTSVFPKLKRLNLSQNRFESLSFIAGKTHEMKTLEFLDLSFNSIVLDEKCNWPAHLTEISLANNNLGNDVFKYLSKSFRKIDLTKTGITTMTQSDVSLLPNLTHLVLSSNGIPFIPDFGESSAVVSLYIDQNSITYLSKEMMDRLPRLQTLKAGNNPYVCTCDSHWFLTRLDKSILVDWPLDYTCSTPQSLTGLPLSEFKTTDQSCLVWLRVVLALSVLTVIVSMIGGLFYKYDGMWYAKMLMVWIRMKRRSKKRSQLLMNVSFAYHGFISYSHHDAGWVDNQLVPCLENAGFSLCVHERDFVPGDWVIDNIINCVEASYKTLFVLSKHFIQSEWCNYELFFAQHRAISIQEDSLVFILLEPLPDDCLPRKFLRLRSLLRQQTYLEWPSDETKQQVFWASLKSMLRMADKSIALKDVAMAISDTAQEMTMKVQKSGPSYHRLK
ncbi:toll-like receptor 1 [Synchiropus splendidus]|uniref:toll-like receptor 1 n=1 Tax=Synchiropus splendidus TaxID=270530 RepID=UPI00237EC300|nr:toll-like receptor 1 [Synchiropus splendidus]